jgi:hypothetical protein
MTAKPLTECTPEELARAEWGHVYYVLRKAQKEFEQAGFGRQSWMDAAVDIAKARAVEAEHRREITAPGQALLVDDSGHIIAIGTRSAIVAASNLQYGEYRADRVFVDPR